MTHNICKRFLECAHPTKTTHTVTRPIVIPSTMTTSTTQMQVDSLHQYSEAVDQFKEFITKLNAVSEKNAETSQRIKHIL